jgi:hypothetical protein
MFPPWQCHSSGTIAATIHVQAQVQESVRGISLHEVAFWQVFLLKPRIFLQIIIQPGNAVFFQFIRGSILGPLKAAVTWDAATNQSIKKDR